jgi:hypothetical protein
MKSILNETDKAELIERINKLTEDKIPDWGKMNVSQMLTHCTVSVKIALGEITPELKEEYMRIGRLVKDKVFETEVFSKDLPTSKEFLVSEDGKFEICRDTFIDYINKFSDTCSDSNKQESHPFLGELTMKEWGALIWKHSNHHLVQFGA